MSDFSLDLAAEKIYQPQTKEYFKEVLSSYNNGNYRSVVVSLYTVVIADLIYKLKDLIDQEEDPGAQRIIDEIEQLRSRDLVSSKWESTLVDRVFENTKMLDLHDKANIEALKAHRNLSAHPAITQDDVLFTPNKETARAHIRNMLEGVLTKPSMFTSHIVKRIIENIPDLYETWGGFWNADGSFERIITKRYLRFLNETGIQKLFRALWKLTYRVENEDTKANIDANAEVLLMLQKMHPHLIHTAIVGERNFYSNITLGKLQIPFLIDFFKQAPRLFPLLEEEIREKVVELITGNFTRLVNAWFISENSEEHLRKVSERIYRSTEPVSNSIIMVKKLAKDAGKPEEFNKLIIHNFSKSTSYNKSYELFRQQIRPSLSQFNEEDYKALFTTMDSTSQIYRLINLSEMIEEIQVIAKETLGHEIDLSPYTHF